MPKRESEYDWAVVPEDLPRQNLVLITAKTPHPTYHKDDMDAPVRLFTPDELFEAARSLAHRPIGLNHLGILQGAFTVDSQYNKSTGNVEALCYFPDDWVGTVRKLISEGKQNIFSVTYTWRNEVPTPDGVKFEGLVFDQVDLVCGLPTGDKYVSGKMVESAVEFGIQITPNTTVPENIKRRAYIEAEVAFPSTIQENNITTANENPSLSFFKECECEYGKLCECDTKLYEAMFVGERLGEPFAGYKDFDACVAANSDKNNPKAYCGYIKHKVEDKKEAIDITGKQDTGAGKVDEHLKGELVSAVRPEDKNPNQILGVDNTDKSLPKQRPAETNLLNNEPQSPIVNQDPPVVEKPVTNVMSAGFTAGSVGPVGIEKAKMDGRQDITFAGQNNQNQSMVKQGETQPTNIPKAMESDIKANNNDGQTSAQGSADSHSVTSTQNPIKEGFDTNPYKGQDHPEGYDKKNLPSGNSSENPVNEGLNGVLGPDKSNQDTYNKKKEESAVSTNPDPKKKPEPTTEEKLAAANAKIVELEAKVTAVEANKTKSESELNTVIGRLQDAAKTSETEKKAAVDAAVKEAKKQMVSKIKEIIPKTTMISGPAQGPARVVYNDLKRLVETETEFQF